MDSIKLTRCTELGILKTLVRLVLGVFDGGVTLFLMGTLESVITHAISILLFLENCEEVDVRYIVSSKDSRCSYLTSIFFVVSSHFLRRFMCTLFRTLPGMYSFRKLRGMCFLVIAHVLVHQDLARVVFIFGSADSFSI